MILDQDEDMQMAGERWGVGGDEARGGRGTAEVGDGGGGCVMWRNRVWDGMKKMMKKGFWTGMRTCRCLVREGDGREKEDIGSPREGVGGVGTFGSHRL